MAKQPLHPAVVQLLGVGAKALNAGLEAFADSLLATTEDAAEEVAARVKRGRSALRGEPHVEGVGVGRPKKRSRRK